MTLTRIETALSKGHIWARMVSGRWWRIRRNGKTKTWVTRPGEWSIPVKAGLRSCTTLTNNSTFGGDGDFMICEFNPNH